MIARRSRGTPRIANRLLRRCRDFAQADGALKHARGRITAEVAEYALRKLEVDDLAPFTRSSFEPYVAEHVLPEAVAIGCRTTEPVDLLLLKAHFA